MRLQPAWSKLKALAHTFSYDVRLIGENGAGRPLPADGWTHLSVPTLLIAGGNSLRVDAKRDARAAEALPGSGHRTLEGQTHLVKPKALATVLGEFFHE